MKRKGVTLIEMIVVMAILSIVLISINSVLISSAKTFNSANSLANIQNESLVISRMISNELKNSNIVTVYDSVPSTFNNTLNYIYLNESDKNIYIKKVGESEKLLFNTNEVEQDIDITYVDYANINIDLTLTSPNATYVNSFGIYFMNIASDSKVNFSPDTSISGKCISYTLID